MHSRNGCERCEKPNRLCLLKLLVHSPVADKLPGIIISQHLGRLSSHQEKKKNHGENYCDEQDCASSEDRDESGLCLPYTAAAAGSDRLTPAPGALCTGTWCSAGAQHQLCSLCWDAAACQAQLASLDLAGKRNPWFAVANMVPLFTQI